eukprot:1419909-Prymnesium_polylepis.2
MDGAMDCALRRRGAARDSQCGLRGRCRTRLDVQPHKRSAVGLAGYPPPWITTWYRLLPRLGEHARYRCVHMHNMRVRLDDRLDHTGWVHNINMLRGVFASGV